jgi:hypothetical protein
MKKIFVVLFLFLGAKMIADTNILDEYWTKIDNINDNIEVMGPYNIYLFNSDGTFIHKIGYNGGLYGEKWFYGTYDYDNKQQRISFNVISSSTWGLLRSKDDAEMPQYISIIEWSNKYIRFIENYGKHESGIIQMYRKEEHINNRILEY